MALLPIHQYFCIDGDLHPVKDFVPSENEGGIYEVLRIASGVPLFFGEHMERFRTSAHIEKKDILFSDKELRSFVRQVIENCQVNEGNILISCKSHLKVHFIPHQYPTAEQYTRGVSCGILAAERRNPNAKVFQTEVRKQANQMIGDQGYYEVLLCDHNNHITEGSRSNVFFISGDTVITPPGKEVLLGITRQKTIQLTKELNFKFQERAVYRNELNGFDAAFITGTSPKLLPICCITEKSYDPQNAMVVALINGYDRYIAACIARSKKLAP